MSDYTRLTFFKPKDALTTGDPNKVVYGSELDAEFSAISTAIGTKYDSTNLATQAQAEAGALNTVLMTPLRSRQATDAYIIAGATSPGIDITSGAVSIAFAAVDAIVGSLDPVNDLVLMYDASAGVNIKVPVGDLVTAGAGDLALASTTLTAGTGLSGGGDLSANRIFSLDVSSNRNIDHSAITLTAGEGLTGGGDATASRSFALDINSLAAATAGTIAVASQSYPLYSISTGDVGTFKATLEDIAISMEATSGAVGTTTLITQANFESTGAGGDGDSVTKGNFETTVAAKGSFKLPGGVLVNYGSKLVPASTTTTDTYNAAFSGTPYMFQASESDPAGQADGAVGARHSSTSVVTLENGYTASRTVYWMVIGPA